MLVAFYTTGDGAQANPASLGITQSQLYARYAAATGASVHEAINSAAAAATLNALPEHGVQRVLFIGHGGPHGFDFVLQSNHFTATDTGLIDALERALAHGQTAAIEFRACDVGQARPLREAIAAAFEAAGHRATLLATSGGYNVRPVVTPRPPHEIVGWACQVMTPTGPRPPEGAMAPPLTAYPLGRNPAAGRR